MEVRVVIAFFALLLFFSSAVRQRDRAQLGITLFYLFLDDIVEPQIVSLWESCIVFKGFAEKKYLHEEHDSSQIRL